MNRTIVVLAKIYRILHARIEILRFLNDERVLLEGWINDHDTRIAFDGSATTAASSDLETMFLDPATLKIGLCGLHRQLHELLSEYAGSVVEAQELSMICKRRVGDDFVIDPPEKSLSGEMRKIWLKFNESGVDGLAKKGWDIEANYKWLLMFAAKTMHLMTDNLVGLERTVARARLESVRNFPASGVGSDVQGMGRQRPR